MWDVFMWRRSFLNSDRKLLKHHHTYDIFFGYINLISVIKPFLNLNKKIKKKTDVSFYFWFFVILIDKYLPTYTY